MKLVHEFIEEDEKTEMLNRILEKISDYCRFTTPMFPKDMVE